MSNRTSARTGQGDTAVCCVRCAKLTSIAFESSRDGNFRCSKCGHEQRVLPEVDDAELGDLRLKDFWTGNYDELAPFMKELGKDVKTSGVDVVLDGVECKVGLSLDSGAVVGLDHVALTVGLPGMRLLTELPEHVDAKAGELVK